MKSVEFDVTVEIIFSPFPFWLIPAYYKKKKQNKTKKETNIVLLSMLPFT